MRGGPIIVSFKRRLLAYAVAGCAVSTVVIFFLGFSIPTNADTEVAAVGQGLPALLDIPALVIYAKVERAGLTPLGAMAVPQAPVDAIWYDLGTRPGHVGSAVIGGHYGWKDGIPAVFDNLSKLRPGDKVYVIDDTGSIAIFVVRRVEIFGEGDDTARIFFSNDGKAHLNLITCGGAWSATAQSYQERLVVFAEKEV